MSFTISSWWVLIKYILQHIWFGVTGCRSCKITPGSVHDLPVPGCPTYLTAPCHGWAHNQLLCPIFLMILTSALWDTCWWTKASIEFCDCFQFVRSAVHIEEERTQIFCIVLWSCLSSGLISVSLNTDWLWDHCCTASMHGLQLGTHVKSQSS